MPGVTQGGRQAKQGETIDTANLQGGRAGRPRSSVLTGGYPPCNTAPTEPSTCSLEGDRLQSGRTGPAPVQGATARIGPLSLPRVRPLSAHLHSSRETGAGMPWQGEVLTAVVEGVLWTEVAQVCKG